MKIKSVQNSGSWVEISAPAAGDLEQDPGTQDVRRVLSGAVRAQNLVILSGLGTSLCVLENGKRLASTMANLLDSIIATFADLDKANGKYARAGGRCSYLLSLANLDKKAAELEYILSRVKNASDFLSSVQSKDAS